MHRHIYTSHCLEQLSSLVCYGVAKTCLKLGFYPKNYRQWRCQELFSFFWTSLCSHFLGIQIDEQSQLNTCTFLRVTRFIFTKKVKPSVKKANKIAEKGQPLKHSIKKGQKKTNLDLTNPKLLSNLNPLNSNSCENSNTSFVPTAPSQKAINSKLFLEFVTYDRKMPKFFTLKKYKTHGLWT